jgi:hypothetical protein
MNIQAEKLNIMKLILETENPRILKSIKNVFAKEQKKDFWEKLTHEQEDEIELGIKDIENGDVDDYEEIIRRHRG